VSNTDPWLVIGVAAIAATAAIIAAIIAAATAGKRQERELRHAEDRQVRELAHDRELAALDDRRKVLDEAAELLLRLNLDLERLPIAHEFAAFPPSAQGHAEVQHVEARLIIRLGIDHPVIEAFRDVVRAMNDVAETKGEIPEPDAYDVPLPPDDRAKLENVRAKLRGELESFLSRAKDAASARTAPDASDR
jgi:hypothetical protein